MQRLQLERKMFRNKRECNKLKIQSSPPTLHFPIHISFHFFSSLDNVHVGDLIHKFEGMGQNNYPRPRNPQKNPENRGKYGYKFFERGRKMWRNSPSYVLIIFYVIFSNFVQLFIFKNGDAY